MPTEEEEEDVEEEMIPRVVDEESKQKAIERLYHYYNYLILE